jgi:hypothetical protein
LQQLNKAGIVAILDHHALPGVQQPGQQFAGRSVNFACSSNNVTQSGWCVGAPQMFNSTYVSLLVLGLGVDLQAQTDVNYHRALVWTAVMTALSHLDPAFSNAVAIEAINEPIMDASKTPGYGNCTTNFDFLILVDIYSLLTPTVQKNFVKVVRAVEFILGIHIQQYSPFQQIAENSLNFTYAMAQGIPQLPDPEVQKAIFQAIPILGQIAHELGIRSVTHQASFVEDRVKRKNAKPLITRYLFYCFYILELLRD